LITRTLSLAVLHGSNRRPGGLGGRRAPPAQEQPPEPAPERSEAGRFDPGQLHQHVAFAHSGPCVPTGRPSVARSGSRSANLLPPFGRETIRAASCRTREVLKGQPARPRSSRAYGRRSQSDRSGPVAGRFDPGQLHSDL